MKKKRTFFSEAAYFVGLILIAAGVVLYDKADFGMSMIVAPAYLLYRWLSPTWSFFTFGMAEYVFQAFLILVMALVLRRFRVSYILSFATAVFYGFLLDGLMLLGVYIPAAFLWQRILLFAIGILLSATGVAMMFHTYLSPEAYELFVMEVSGAFHIPLSKFKTVYDIISCLVGLIMSFLIFGFGKFVGVNWGTVVCAVVNGFLIGRFSALYEKHLHFRDALPWRHFFTGDDRVE